MSNKVKKIKKNILGRDFVIFPDPILREQSNPIEEFGTYELEKIINKLRDSLIAQKGLAVAGPQIGVLKNIFYYQMPDGERSEVINPRILDCSDELSKYDEGCLSMRGYYWEVERPEYILAEWYTKKGVKKQAKIDGLESRMFQHEIDHLNGVLILDYLSDEDYEIFENDYFIREKRGEDGPMFVNKNN